MKTKAMAVLLLSLSVLSVGHAGEFYLQVTSSPGDGARNGIKLGGSGEKWGGNFIFIGTDHSVSDLNKEYDFQFYERFDAPVGQNEYIDDIFGGEVYRNFRYDKGRFLSAADCCLCLSAKKL